MVNKLPKHLEILFNLKLYLGYLNNWQPEDDVQGPVFDEAAQVLSLRKNKINLHPLKKLTNKIIDFRAACLGPKTIWNVSWGGCYELAPQKQEEFVTTWLVDDNGGQDDLQLAD